MRSGALSPGWMAICLLNKPVSMDQARAPVRGAHFLDHAQLDFVSGLEAVDVLLEENREALARFAFHNDIWRTSRDGWRFARN
jgi:hypothetical protein